MTTAQLAKMATILTKARTLIAEVHQSGETVRAQKMAMHVGGLEDIFNTAVEENENHRGGRV